MIVYVCAFVRLYDCESMMCVVLFWRSEELSVWKWKWCEVLAVFGEAAMTVYLVVSSVFFFGGRVCGVCVSFVMVSFVCGHICVWLRYVEVSLCVYMYVFACVLRYLWT